MIANELQKALLFIDKLFIRATIYLHFFNLTNTNHPISANFCARAWSYREILVLFLALKQLKAMRADMHKYTMRNIITEGWSKLRDGRLGDDELSGEVGCVFFLLLLNSGIPCYWYSYFPL